MERTVGAGIRVLGRSTKMSGASVLTGDGVHNRRHEFFSVELIRVLNGWIAKPPTNYAEGPRVSFGDEIRVFNDTEEMCEWLRGYAPGVDPETQ